MSQLFEIPPPDQNEPTSPREPTVRDPNQPTGSPLPVVRDQDERTGRPRFSALVPVVRDPTQVARVERLAQVGATPEDIAVELQMSLKRLHKRFRRELERGAVRGKHDVLEKLFEIASSGANTAATLFWVKARCGWRDTGPVSNPPSVIQSVLKIVVAKPECANEKQKESPS